MAHDERVGVPTLYISALTYNYVHKLATKGQHVPDIILAGGFAFEDDIFKAFALGAPYVKAVGMARSPLCAAHVGKLLGDQIKTNALDKGVESYGKTMDEVFVLAPKANRLFGSNGRKVPPGAIGVYSYYQRLSQGLRQIMAGSRKFALEHITRDDITSLTREAAEITGIRYIMDTDSEVAEQILMGKETGKAKVASKANVKVTAKAKSKAAPKANEKGKTKKKK